MEGGTRDHLERAPSVGLRETLVCHLSPWGPFTGQPHSPPSSETSPCALAFHSPSLTTWTPRFQVFRRPLGKDTPFPAGTLVAGQSHQLACGKHRILEGET